LFVINNNEGGGKMNESQRYFGMTRLQVGILAGLAGLLCLVLAVGGWFVLRNSSAGFTSPSTRTPEPTVTSAALVTPTVVPTMTPTPIPYEQLIPSGWKQYKTALVEIWLPANFKLAGKTVEKPTGLAVSELLITEIPNKYSIYNMVVGVSYDLMVGDSLEAYLDGKLVELPQTSHVANRRTVFVNSVEARRIVIETRVDNVDDNELIYVFLDGNTVWYVEYGAQIAKYFDNLPVFEQSIKTFRIVR
jgi:hypothetical protein